jgi:glycerol-3-phosphate cytidylyltransferase
MDKKYKIGVTFGAWDLLHAGHMHLFNTMATECDNVIIGLHIDPSVERPEKLEPAESVFARYMRIFGFNWRGTVVSVIPYEREEDIETILSLFDINVRYLGDDYQTIPLDSMTGHTIMMKKNIETRFVGRNHPWSTSSIKKKIYEIMSQVRAC